MGVISSVPVIIKLMLMCVGLAGSFTKHNNNVVSQVICECIYPTLFEGNCSFLFLLLLLLFSLFSPLLVFILFLVLIVIIYISLFTVYIVRKYIGKNTDQRLHNSFIKMQVGMYYL